MNVASVAASPVLSNCNNNKREIYQFKRKAMKAIEQLSLPNDYKKDIDKAVMILKESGCSNVYLFGSLATGEFKVQSDIDLAIRGCPKGQFFMLLGKLLFELKHSVDLINLDYKDAFSHPLEMEGELIEIG